MTTTNYSSLQLQKGASRSIVLRMITSGLNHKNIRFARQTALKWLASYPGDLGFNLVLAKALAIEGKFDQAVSILEKVVDTDPEYIEALSYLKTISRSGKKIGERKNASAKLFALIGHGAMEDNIPDWSKSLNRAKQYLEKDLTEKAEEEIYQVLGTNQQEILGAIFHVQALRQQKDFVSVAKFADLYHQKWPDCVQFMLGLAEAKLFLGEEADAVNMLHFCATKDATGQVARRWWGDNHPFLPIWPDNLEISFDLPVPAEVAADMGWNLLPGKMAKSVEDDTGEEESTIERPEYINSDLGKEVEAEFEKIARRLKKPKLIKADGRFPVYVIFSSAICLKKQYGEQTTKILIQEMKTLASVVDKRAGWNAELFLPDDEGVAKSFNLSAIKTVDPWKLKLSLNDLDKALAARGERIGALMIVGGEEIVPFHRLPNPTDDIDNEVASDNPYGTLDTNYFVQDWPVGRLPGESGADAGLLLQQLRSIIADHKQANSTAGIFRRMWVSLSSIVKPGNLSSFGYTASVWQRASIAVYRPIGQAQNLAVSPAQKNSVPSFTKLANAQLAYFNLHGIEDGAEWYGQRDVADLAGPDYPVALSPTDLRKNGGSPEFVFTEACYGGHIMSKNEKSSIALKFLNNGTKIVVGSTSTSYGSVTTPLIGADLLGYLFWTNLREGRTAGDAFLQAKISLVTEMQKRQGYLDGEDQKTLIQFVMYGDPLTAYEAKLIRTKAMVRIQSETEVQTVSDKKDGVDPKDTVSEEILANVRKALMPYLPGLDFAEVHLNQQQYEVRRDRNRTESSKQEVLVEQKTLTNRIVLTFKNLVQVDHRTSYHFARVTLDKKGKVMKMAVSR